MAPRLVYRYRFDTRTLSQICLMQIASEYVYVSLWLIVKINIDVFIDYALLNRFNTRSNQYIGIVIVISRACR